MCKILYKSPKEDMNEVTDAYEAGYVVSGFEPTRLDKQRCNPRLVGLLTHVHAFRVCVCVCYRRPQVHTMSATRYQFRCTTAATVIGSSREWTCHVPDLAASGCNVALPSVSSRSERGARTDRPAVLTIIRHVKSLVVSSCRSCLFVSVFAA